MPINILSRAWRRHPDASYLTGSDRSKTKSGQNAIITKQGAVSFLWMIHSINFDIVFLVLFKINGPAWMVGI